MFEYKAFGANLSEKFDKGIINGIKDIHLIKDLHLIVQTILFILNIMFMKNNCSKNKLYHIITIILLPDIYFLFSKINLICNY